MPVRVRRNGKLEWRFWIDGHQYSEVTDLDDTRPNRIKAQRIEAEKRKLVLEGNAHELRINVRPFDKAAESFLTWARGEYRSHPNSWKRLRGSITSAEAFFGRKPLSSITKGDIEDYKGWRRICPRCSGRGCEACGQTGQGVREVTLRHDLHALSLVFQYGAKHDWCRVNRVREVEVPSDKDAVRINVLSKAQELKYFAACEALRLEKLARKRSKEARGLQDLYDLHTLMLQQGCRPEELRALPQSDVDLENGKITIRNGKSTAAKRILKLRINSLSILARRLQTQGRWVFPSAKNPGQHIGSHQRLHDAILRHSGVSCVPYDFRHTFASRAANDEKMPLPILAAILGHSNLRSIMKYVHTDQDQMDREMARLDGAEQTSWHQLGDQRTGPGPVGTGHDSEEKGKYRNDREPANPMKN